MKGFYTKIPQRLHIHRKNKTQTNLQTDTWMKDLYRIKVTAATLLSSSNAIIAFLRLFLQCIHIKKN